MEIRVEFEDLSAVRKRMKVEVPAQVAQEELNSVAREYRRHASLSGFRKGKAPLGLVKRHFARKIREDVIQQLVPKSYDQAIREQGVEPLEEPALDHLSFEEGKPLVYEARFEVRPSIDLPQYRELEVAAETREVTDENVAEALEELRQKQARLVSASERPVDLEDYVVIDLDGEYLDQKAEPIHDENIVVRIGDEHTHDAFNKALMGMKVGEEKEFEVSYAPEYPEAKLAGHRVRFRARVGEIKEKQLPDLDDEFARELGEHETLEELKSAIRQRLEAARERNREDDLKNQLVEQLIEATTFEVPASLIENRIDRMIQDVAYRMTYQGIDPSKADVDWVKVRADMRPDAEKQVRAHLILSEIASQEKIEISAEELEEEIGRAAESMGQPVEKVRQYFQRENRIEGLKSDIARRKALDLLLAEARVD